MNIRTCFIFCAILHSIPSLADGERNGPLQARLVNVPPSALAGSTVEVAYAIANFSTGPVIICTRDIMASYSWSGFPYTLVVDENGQESNLSMHGGSWAVAATCRPPISSNDFLTLQIHDEYKETFEFAIPSNASLTAVTFNASFQLPNAYHELGYMNWTGQIVSGETTITIEK